MANFRYTAAMILGVVAGFVVNVEVSAAPKFLPTERQDQPAVGSYAVFVVAVLDGCE